MSVFELDLEESGGAGALSAVADGGGVGAPALPHLHLLPDHHERGVGAWTESSVVKELSCSSVVANAVVK